jgi:DNA repair exonuclease SbcCD ATPase subunit
LGLIKEPSMLHQLKLTNFRKVRDHTVDFTPGINIIKGNNEASKSTRFEAVAYAFFGARALRESLADTVTWGEPESSLRVVLNFTFDGVHYNLYRAKSGCELVYDGGRVTGQSDVTRYIETLLGVNAETAGRLMLAEQNSLRGSLTAGPTATVQLIETLAGFSLMDDLVTKIQEQLPCGSVVAVQTRIDQLQSAAAVAVPDAPPVEDKSFEVRQLEAEAAYARAKEAFSEKVPAFAAARQKIAELAARKSGDLVRQANLTNLEQALAQELVEPDVTPEQIQAWQTGAADQKSQARLWAAYSKSVPQCASSWSGDRQSFKAAAVGDRVKLENLQKELTVTVQQAREAKLLKINETNCAFCKKSLEDVPEVAQLNAAQDAKVIALETAAGALRGSIAELQATVACYADLEQVDAQISKGFPEDLFSYSDTMPIQPKWLGPVPTNPADGQDLAALAKSGLAKLQAYNTSWALRTQQTADAQGLRSQLALPLPDVTAELALLESGQLESAELSRLVSASAAAESEAKLAAAAYKTAQRDYERQVAEAKAATANLQAAQAELLAIVTHNDLIKKIRSARPVVAATLWGSVLAASGHYFTQIRGEPSVVTRSAGGFQVNGRGVAGLSGSTLDSLGLALRLAVTKTFLPSIDFLMLDEPASGCDDDRETSMLGVVATCGFSQVLLVTHSDLADSFAANLIQI